MKRFLHVLTRLLLISAATLAHAVSATNDPKPHLENKVVVADGLHLWYEIKSDPEDSAKVIICGTKWDALANTPLGFVYFSADAGRTWRKVLEDRSSVWVTEHSCAFGPRHRAFFISDAARETELSTSPKQGTTRLFVSTDAGENWTESVQTGWTDYSTSAVSKTSGRLYTFFHTSWMTRDQSRQKGNDLGVLVFPPDGRTAAGPFFSSTVRDRGYGGIYPSNAVAVQSGAVVAMYYAITQRGGTSGSELGVVRAGDSEDPVLTQAIIADPVKDVLGVCANFDNGSMAYEQTHNKLFVIYSDGCGVDARLMLTTSDDEGRHWSRAVPISIPKVFAGKIYSPSLVSISQGILGLLWENGVSSPTWFFSKIENATLANPPVILSKGPDRAEISNDSLWTEISQPDDVQIGPAPTTKSCIKVNMFSMLNDLWRTEGLLFTNDKVLAIWSSGTAEGMNLFFGAIGMTASDSVDVSTDDSTLADVTRNTILVYGGDRGEAGQHYDQAAGTVRICASLRNRGREAIRRPIQVRIEDLQSSWGTISPMNATSASENHGALWDISGSLTGDRIPPETASNPFCISFRLDRKPDTTSPIPANLLNFNIRVFARRGDGRQ